MKKYLLALLAVAALSTSVVFAQHMRTPPDPATMVQHHVDHLTKALSLTPAQQQQATTMLTGLMQGQQAQHEQMKAAHDSLKAAVQKNDAAGIEQAAATIGNLTAQGIAAHAKAQAAFAQTLTPDQQAKFSSMEMGGEGMHGHGRMRGHGGPGMHGGPPPSNQ